MKEGKKKCDLCGSVVHIELFFGTTSYLQTDLCKKHLVDFTIDYHKNFNQWIEKWEANQKEIILKEKIKKKESFLDGIVKDLIHLQYDYKTSYSIGDQKLKSLIVKYKEIANKKAIKRKGIELIDDIVKDLQELKYNYENRIRACGDESLELMIKKYKELANTKTIRKKGSKSHFILENKSCMIEKVKLSDFFEKGDTEIWYWKSPIWARWDYDLERGKDNIENRISEIKKMIVKSSKEERIRLSGELEYYQNFINFFKPTLTYDILKKTHIKLGQIDLINVDRIFWALQGENWSSGKNQVKAQELVRSLKTHTSMSTGDIILFPKRKKLFVVKSIGFKVYEFTTNIKSEKKDSKSHLILKTGTYRLQKGKDSL
jgi:hypothetical protein